MAKISAQLYFLSETFAILGGNQSVSDDVGFVFTDVYQKIIVMDMQIATDSFYFESIKW